MKTRKSKTLRKVHVRTPGSKSKVAYKKRKPAKSKCSSCGETLKGVPRGRPYQLKKISKSKKRPERIYGGVLCSKCLKRKLIRGARKYE
ncbi:50S ribosomal protein L34e [archaeon]|nr:50S ribosomal protein L34e [archaeon]